VAAVPSPSVPPPAQPATVASLVEHDELEPLLTLLAGEPGLTRSVDHPRIQKNGLALAGHHHGLVPTRVQILGETELSFLEQMEPPLRAQRMQELFALGLSCVVVTRGVDPPAELVEAAAETETPLFVSDARSSRTIFAIHRALDRLLAPREQRHGVMVEVYGIGMLLLGQSGIGKSECALFLGERGHRLVADDMVVLTRLPGDQLLASPAPLLKHHLEIRGIGILNIRDLFGATSVWDEAVLDLVVQLQPWDDNQPYDRLGLDPLVEEVLGVELPKLQIPVRPGRDMAVILEVAARNELMKEAGTHAARDFARRLSRELGLEPPDG